MTTVVKRFKDRHVTFYLTNDNRIFFMRDKPSTRPLNIYRQTGAATLAALDHYAALDTSVYPFYVYLMKESTLYPYGKFESSLNILVSSVSSQLVLGYPELSSPFWESINLAIPASVSKCANPQAPEKPAQGTKLDALASVEAIKKEVVEEIVESVHALESKSKVYEAMVTALYRKYDIYATHPLYLTKLKLVHAWARKEAKK